MSAWVYRCYSADDECLYVGASRDVDARIAAHKTVTSWAWDVTRVETTECESYTAALVEELKQIKTHRPRWNIGGRGPRIEWDLADFVEVILASAARFNGHVSDAPNTGRKIDRLKRDLARRFPDVAPVILADIEPHLAGVPAA